MDLNKANICKSIYDVPYLSAMLEKIRASLSVNIWKIWIIVPKEGSFNYEMFELNLLKYSGKH